MRKTLVMDEATREMRVRYHDLWRGNHEVTEYRVTGQRGGTVLRNLPDFDGMDVRGHAPDLYVKAGPWGERVIPVWTEEVAVGPAVKTPCPRAANARRKCALCAAL